MAFLPSVSMGGQLADDTGDRLARDEPQHGFEVQFNPCHFFRNANPLDRAVPKNGLLVQAADTENNFVEEDTATFEFPTDNPPSLGVLGDMPEPTYDFHCDIAHRVLLTLCTSMAASPIRTPRGPHSHGW